MKNRHALRTRAVDIAGVEKKLRQAEFFLGWLEHCTKEMMAQQLARGNADTEQLEYWFSACLSAAQSVYFILQDSGGKMFKDTQRDWRNNNPRGQQFGRMIGLRGGDVHLGATGAKPLPKVVEYDWRHQAPGSFIFHNPALLGEAPVIEEVNPDGARIMASSFRGTVGLYLDQDDQFVEATTLCREFIDHLRALLEAVKNAEHSRTVVAT